jgi:hypothetical protein
MNFSTLIKKPSAFVSVAISFDVLHTLFSHFVKFGVVHQAVEVTAAQIFQIFMAGHVPIMAFFTIKWLPGIPRQPLQALALQAGPALAALAPAFY